MVSLLSRGVGLLAKFLAGLTYTPATRCSSLPRTISVVQCATSRWFTKSSAPEDFRSMVAPEKPPKRPISSFFRFVQQRRPALLAQHPEASILEIAKIAGREWRALSEAEKQVYLDAARADILTYREHFQKYKEKLDPVDLDMLKDQRKQRNERRRLMRKKREKTIYGKPKRCRTAYNIFMAEHFHEAKGDSLQAKLKHMTKEWEKLPKTNKQVYIHLAEDDKVRYENEMKAWEEEMVEIGRQDLVRYKERVRLLRNSSRIVKKPARVKDKESEHLSGKKRSPRLHEE